MPGTMKAVVLKSKGLENMHVLEDFPRPSEPKGKEVLVHVKAAAINPVDWKMAAYDFFIKSYPIVLGCDIAGVVESVGPDVTRFKKGDKVYGLTPLGTPGCGGFAEYAKGREEFMGKIPDGMDFGSASTIPVGLGTAILGLFSPDNLGFGPPSRATENKDRKLLIWGASSSVGTYAVQLAKNAGVGKIVAYAKELGATHVVSRNAKDEEIAKEHPDLTDVFDCVGPETAEIGLKLLKSGGKLSGPAGTPKEGNEGVKISDTLLGDIYDNPRKLAWFEPFFNKEVIPLIDSRKVVPSPPKEVVAHRLNGVIMGLKKQKFGVSAVKLFVEVA